MEIFELRYFLGVAREENFHRASEKLHISPGSLNKAVARLESELAIKLFTREGRNIRLTEHGRLFQKRAAEIVHLEEAARMELSGHQGSIRVIMAGSDNLLAEVGIGITEKLTEKFPKSTFEYRTLDDEASIEEVIRGEAHLALVTKDVPASSGLESKILKESHFHTVIGKKHPLYSAAVAGNTVSVERLVEFPFVSPSSPFLGKVSAKQSSDGWRDDQFPRNIQFITSSLKLLEALVSQGKAVAYLPEYVFGSLDVRILKISGCPYSCVQKIRLVAKNPKGRTWLKQWF